MSRTFHHIIVVYRDQAVVQFRQGESDHDQRQSRQHGIIIGDMFLLK
jgi:hypothetical protein